MAVFVQLSERSRACLACAQLPDRRWSCAPMQVQSRSAACVSYRGYGGDIIGRSYMFIYLPYTHSAHTTRLESRVEALLDATCGPPDPRAPEATPGWTFSSEFTSTDLALGQVEASFWACFEGFRLKAHFDRFKL